MNIVDFGIIVFVIVSLIRGAEIGFVRQFFSTVGFFTGLLLGAWLLEPITTSQTTTELSRSLTAIITTLGSAFIFMSLGEYMGAVLKNRIEVGDVAKIKKADTGFGMALSVISLLFVVWLGAALFSSLPGGGMQTALNSSRIVTALNERMPPAPSIIADLGKLINPNGFPQVFTGPERAPDTEVRDTNLTGFDAALDGARDSVVKIQGLGCGGIVSGTGFVVGEGLIATNAHVVAGITRPTVEDANGRHSATTIWFDSDLDFAVLRASNLAGDPLIFNTDPQARGTAAAILGYPAGGPYTVRRATILDEYTAVGRNIYGEGATARRVYEVKSNITSGNSGGPMITIDGRVIGVVFAESTTYEDIGYVLTANRVVSEINQARDRTSAVSTGSCAR